MRTDGTRRYRLFRRARDMPRFVKQGQPHIFTPPLRIFH